MARKTGPSRARQRQRLWEAAARADVPAATDVCVVGGGAAGLVAAISAAEAGAKVVVLERDLACGRTILATGNGRCNFSNERLDPALYNDPSFVRAVCGETWLSDVLGFFATSGLAWEAEDGGRLYPLSRQAASVRNVLLTRAERAGVLLAPAREVEEVSGADGGGFVVRYRDPHQGGHTPGPAEPSGKAPARHAVTAHEDSPRMAGASSATGDAGRAAVLAAGHAGGRVVNARRVIIATGGGVASASGPLGLVTEPFRPLLCPLECTGPLLEELDGRRARARVTLSRQGRAVACEEGEVLFRPYGLSGIVVFNLSRYTAACDELTLDLLPHLDPEQVRNRSAHTLDGLLDPVVAEALLKRGHTRGRALEEARHLAYRVVGTAETSHAQVSRGGLACAQFDPSTLEACDVPGVFACGEALNVDGPCGGFNLAWAWKSGLVAGGAAGMP